MEKNDEKQSYKTFKFLDILTAIFILALVLSNIASSAKIIDWGFNIGPIRFAFDAGTILFPISYIIGDVLTEVYGFKHSKRIIWIGFSSLIFSAIVFWFVQILPSEATWQASVGQETYNKILGSMSSGSIILASLAGYLAGSFSNAIMMAVMKVLTKGKLLWSRTIGSTIIGQAFDTFTFILVTTALGVFPWSLFWSLTVTNYIFKVLMEALVTPLTYWVVNTLKTAEDIDVLDESIRLNPFR